MRTQCLDYSARWIPYRHEPVGSSGWSANPGDGAIRPRNSQMVRTLLLQLDMLASSVFLETSIPNIPSITVLSFHLVYSARAPLRTTLYAGSTLTRVPRYRPI